MSFDARKQRSSWSMKSSRSKRKGPRGDCCWWKRGGGESGERVAVADAADWLSSETELSQRETKEIQNAHKTARTQDAGHGDRRTGGHGRGRGHSWDAGRRTLTHAYTQSPLADTGQRDECATSLLCLTACPSLWRSVQLPLWWRLRLDKAIFS